MSVGDMSHMLRGENEGTCRVCLCGSKCVRMHVCVCDCMTVGQSAVARECGVAERRRVMEAVVTHEARDQL